MSYQSYLNFVGLEAGLMKRDFFFRGALSEKEAMDEEIAECALPEDAMADVTSEDFELNEMKLTKSIEGWKKDTMDEIEEVPTYLCVN